jgi:hypothetical protein
MVRDPRKCNPAIHPQSSAGVVPFSSHKVHSHPMYAQLRHSVEKAKLCSSLSDYLRTAKERQAITGLASRETGN